MAVFDILNEGYARLWFEVIYGEEVMPHTPVHQSQLLLIFEPNSEVLGLFGHVARSVSQIRSNHTH